MYVDTVTDKQYRWGGSTYTEISASPGSTDAVPEGATNLYFTAARVRSVALTGLSTATNAAISATDTLLAALGKLQAQLNAQGTTLGGKLDKTSNLSYLNSASTARSNLGLGSISTANAPVSTADPQGGCDDDIWFKVT